MDQKELPKTLIREVNLRLGGLVVWRRLISDGKKSSILLSRTKLEERVYDFYDYQYKVLALSLV